MKRGKEICMFQILFSLKPDSFSDWVTSSRQDGKRYHWRILFYVSKVK